jgi:hypothetical protein
MKKHGDRPRRSRYAVYERLAPVLKGEEKSSDQEKDSQWSLHTGLSRWVWVINDEIRLPEDYK